MENAEIKLLHHGLNLDYAQKNIPLQTQTNQLINKIMNEFVVKYEKNFKDKYIILISQNDTFTLIAYNILKGIQTLVPFQLLIYGKSSIIKKYLKRRKIKEKFISKRILLKLNKINKAIKISCYNPLYQVANFKKFYNGFVRNTDYLKYDYNILDKFTLSELKVARIFYHINWIKDDDIYFNNNSCEIYDSFCYGKFPKNGSLELEILLDKLNIRKKKFDINIVKLTKNNEKDIELLQQVQDSDGLIFYFISDVIENYPILFSEYQYYLKNKSNIPNYWNINTFSNVSYIIKRQQYLTINFIGDFSDIEKVIWLDNEKIN